MKDSRASSLILGKRTGELRLVAKLNKISLAIHPPPTIIDMPADDSRIVTEDFFGPVLPLLTWFDEDEVVARANNTLMGLGASIWSDDQEEANRIAEQLEAGSVWINSHVKLGPNAPFGGQKESVIGCKYLITFHTSARGCG